MEENKENPISKEDLEKYRLPKSQMPCPHCGYCPTCGRPYGNYNYPYYPSPYYPGYPGTAPTVWY